MAVCVLRCLCDEHTCLATHCGWLAARSSSTAAFLQECDALDVQQPVLHCLNDVAADISDVATSWAVFRDFLAERDILAHREWLSTRDHVWKVEDFVAKWESSCSNSGGDVTTGGGQNGCGGSSSSNSTGRVGAEHAPAATDQQAPRNAGQIAIAHILTREIDAYRCEEVLQGGVWGRHACRLAGKVPTFISTVVGMSLPAGSSASISHTAMTALLWQ